MPRQHGYPTLAAKLGYGFELHSIIWVTVNHLFTIDHSYYSRVLATAHIEVDSRTIQFFTEFLHDEGVVVPDSQLAQTIKDVIRDMAREKRCD